MLIENIDKVPVSVALCTLGRIVICFPILQFSTAFSTPVLFGLLGICYVFSVTLIPSFAGRGSCAAAEQTIGTASRGK